MIQYLTMLHVPKHLNFFLSVCWQEKTAFVKVRF